MSKKLTFLISLFFLSLILGQTNFLFAQEFGQLEIASKKECESLGGTWNDCPPNDCQKSDGYKNGEVTCPAVCGEPHCEGIVPEEKGDLSEIQNPTLYKKLDPLNEESITPSDAADPLAAPSVDQNSKQLLDFGKIARASVVILGLLILYAYYLLKHKKRKHR